MTGGPNPRDESVRFSLKELMKLEDERIDQESEARVARERSAKAARENAERCARAELEERERAESDARERTRLRAREEEARLEAMQRATIEQARITVEARTRCEESERERSHERELQRMRLDAQKKPELGALIGSGLGGVALALAAFLFFFFAVAKPASDRRIAELDRTVATAEGRAGALERRVEEQNSKLSAMAKELEAARARDVTAPAPTSPRSTAPAVKAGSGAQAPMKPLLKDEKPCAPRDPMCFHIP